MLGLCLAPKLSSQILATIEACQLLITPDRCELVVKNSLWRENTHTRLTFHFDTHSGFHFSNIKDGQIILFSEYNGLLLFSVLLSFINTNKKSKNKYSQFYTNTSV